MFKIRLAELNIGVSCICDYTREMCADYMTDGECDFSVSVTEEDIDREDDGSGFDRGYLESLAVYRKIAERLLDYDGFLMHGVVVDVDGAGVAFLARSGTGKSTHSAFWQGYFGDRLTVVNGDKPLVRMTDGGAYAYGTPWAGKEGFNKNTKTRLEKICFIERCEKNYVEKAEGRDVLMRLCAQIYMPPDGAKKLKTFELCDRFIRSCEFYIINCNIDPQAAEVAARGVGIIDR